MRASVVAASPMAPRAALIVGDPMNGWGPGRVTLLGAAAHPMPPHTGQGGGPGA